MSKEKKTKIALICLDKIGENMAGPGIRAVEMAKVLAKDFPVLLLAPEGSKYESTTPNLVFKTYHGNKPTNATFPLLQDSTHIICQSLRPPLLAKIKQASIIYIADLYDPVIIESMEYFKYSPARFQSHNFNFQRALLLIQLYACDYFLCASERQRSFYLGLLAAEKIVNPKNYLATPEVNLISSLVPFGLPGTPPEVKNPNALEEMCPGIKPEDKVIYWGGGIWNWFDPLSIVKAIESISKKRSDVKLFFLGVKHPNPEIKEMEMAQKTLEYAKSHQLLDKFIFFNFGWTPYNERVNFLARANIAVSTHFDNLETHLSFRTRVLDYLWAELPMILTKGDSMAELADSHQLGFVVDYADPEGIEKAILKLCDNPGKISEIKNNISEVKNQFYWGNLLVNLTKYIKDSKSHAQKSTNSLRYLQLVWQFYFSGLLKKMSKK